MPVKFIGKAFASLALASSFWHGSETRNGQAADVRINDLFAYVAYQEAVKNLKGNASIIHDLNYSPRYYKYKIKNDILIIFHNCVNCLLRKSDENCFNFRAQSGEEITDFFMNMYIETPVEEWGHILNATDFPDLRITMCGYFSLALSMSFEESFVDNLVVILANAFS